MSAEKRILQVRYIPTWMPGAGFKRTALKARAMIMEMLDMPYEMVKEGRVGCF